MADKSKIEIRMAEFEDAETICKFNVEMAKETENLQLDGNIVLKGVTNLLENSRMGFYLVAEIGDEIVASLLVTYEWSDWRNGLFWWLQSVYVKKKYRRSGVFRQMFEFVEKKAAMEDEVCGIRLYVERTNVVARSVYLTIGMDETNYRLYEKIL